MITITSINRQSSRILMEHCLNVLQKSLDGQLSVKATGGTISSDNEVTLKFTLALQTPEADTKREEIQRECLAILGLPDAMGKTFQMRGAHHATLTYTIVGADLGKSKYNVHAKRPDGKVMRFQAHDVIRLLGMETV